PGPGPNPSRNPPRPWPIFFLSRRRRHTRSYGDWSSDVCSSDLVLDRVVAGGDDEIGAVEPARDRVAQLEADRSQRELVVPGDAQIGRASCRERGELSVVPGGPKGTRSPREEARTHRLRAARKGA